MRRAPIITAALLLTATPAAAAPTDRDSFELAGHRAPIVFAGFSADSKVLTTVDEQSAVRRWDARTGDLLSSRIDTPLPREHPRLVEKELWNLAPPRSFTPDGSAVAWVTGQGAVRIRDLTTGKEREVCPPDGLEFHAAALSPDGKVLATAAVRGEDRQTFARLQFWDPTTGKPSLTADPPKRVSGLPAIPPVRMTFTPDGTTLVTTDSCVRFWDVATGRERAGTFIGQAVSVSFSPRGKAVALGLVIPSVEGVGSGVMVFDTATGNHVATLQQRGTLFTAGWFLPDGRAVAAQVPAAPGKRAAYVQLWDAATWKESARLDGWFAAAAPNGKVVLTLAPDGERGDHILTAWDATTGVRRRQFPRSCLPWTAAYLPHGFLPDRAVAFSPDGARLAVVTGWTDGADRPGMVVRVVDTTALVPPVTTRPPSYLMIPGGSLPRPAVPARPDAPPVERFLHAGELAKGEQALELALAADPADDQARFSLGVVRFVRAVERLAQSLHEYGMKPADDVPFLRLPVPHNPAPNRISHPVFRRILDDFGRDLALAEGTLAGVKDARVKLPLRLAAVRLDLDGDGEATDRLSDLLVRIFGRNLDLLKANPDLRVCFDRADVAWFRGYCHLLMGMTDVMLAFDGKPAFEATAHLCFTNPRTKNVDRADADLAQLLAAAANLCVREPDRLRRARAHLLAVCDLTEETWGFALAEQDDEDEWLPNPRQEGALGVRVTADMVDAWRAIMREARAVLRGEKLVPVRGPRWAAGQGFDLHGFLERPPERIDLIDWFSNGPKDYLRKGPAADDRVWDRADRAFGPNFPRFAVWFN